MLSRLLVLACGVVLSGCVQTGDDVTVDPVSHTEVLEPVDALQVYSDFLAEDSSRLAFPLVDDSNEGFYFSPEFVRVAQLRIGGLTTFDTVIDDVDGNRVCLAPSGTWSGVCLEVFEGEGIGTYFVKGRYGNGVAVGTSVARRPPHRSPHAR